MMSPRALTARQPSTPHATDGRVYDGFGPTYFRISGECGHHFPGHQTPGWPTRREGAYFCERCDQPMPDITRALLGEETPNG